MVCGTYVYKKLQTGSFVNRCNNLWGKCAYKQHNRNGNTINISAIKIHIYTSKFTHENQWNKFLINQCNEPTRDGTTTFHLTIDWMSQISLQSITPIPYSKHECGTHITYQKHQSTWMPPELSAYTVGNLSAS